MIRLDPPCWVLITRHWRRPAQLLQATLMSLLLRRARLKQHQCGGHLARTPLVRCVRLATLYGAGVVGGMRLPAWELDFCVAVVDQQTVLILHELGGFVQVGIQSQVIRCNFPRHCMLN